MFRVKVIDLTCIYHKLASEKQKPCEFWLLSSVHERIHTVIWHWLSHFLIAQPSVFDPKTEAKKNFKLIYRKTLQKKTLYNKYQEQKTSKK